MKNLRKIIKTIIRESDLGSVMAGHDATVKDMKKKYPGQLKSMRYHSDKQDLNYHIRDIKRAWNKHADHSFFQDPNKLTPVHMLNLYSTTDLYGYFPDVMEIHLQASIKNNIIDDSDTIDFYRDVGFYEEVISQLPNGSVKIPGIHVPNKNELSCFGYKGNKDRAIGTVGSAYSFFTFKTYRVTFASNADIQSERIGYARGKDLKRYKSSGYPKRPAADIDLANVPLDETDAENVMREVIIDNWIVDTYYGPEKDRAAAEKLGIKFVKR